MTLTWEAVDIEIKEGLANSQVLSGMLKVSLSILLVKNVIDYDMRVNDVQQQLLKEFHVEYKLRDIEDELVCMMFDKQEAEKDITDYEEDYYPGY